MKEEVRFAGEVSRPESHIYEGLKGLLMDNLPDSAARANMLNYLRSQLIADKREEIERNHAQLNLLEQDLKCLQSIGMAQDDTPKSSYR